MIELPHVRFDEPPEVYESLRAEYITSHSLGDFKKSPVKFAASRGKQKDRDQRAAHFILGEAVHAAILEGAEAYSQRFHVPMGEYVNPKTGKHYNLGTKAWGKAMDEVRAATGKTALPMQDHAQVMRFMANIHHHRLARELLSCGFPEVTARAEWYGVPCQSRIDWVTVPQGEWCDGLREATVVDLKTILSLDLVNEHISNFGYAHQLAFYARQLQANGVEVDSCHIIFLDKSTAQVQVESYAIEDLSSHMAANDHAMATLGECLLLDSWPGKYTYTEEVDFGS